MLRPTASKLIDLQSAIISDIIMKSSYKHVDVYLQKGNGLGFDEWLWLRDTDSTLKARSDALVSCKPSSGHIAQRAWRWYLSQTNVSECIAVRRSPSVILSQWLNQSMGWVKVGE